MASVTKRCLYITLQSYPGDDKWWPFLSSLPQERGGGGGREQAPPFRRGGALWGHNFVAVDSENHEKRV